MVNIYDDCCYNSSREFVRTPIRTDPTYPYLAVTLSRNGRGVGFLDARMPLPLHFLCDLHSSDMIRDIVFLDSSWPFVPRNNHAIATITHDGNCKVTTLDGSITQNFEVGHKTNSLAATPERFDVNANAGYRSSITFGGDFMSIYLPELCASPSSEKVQATRTQNARLSSLIPDYHLNRHIHLRLNQLSSNSLTAAANSLSSTISIHPPIHAAIHSRQHPIQSAHSASIHSHPSTGHASVHPPPPHSGQDHHSYLISSSLSAANGVALIAQQNRRVSGLINTSMLQDRISLLKYGSNGGLLYAVSNSSQNYCVQRFRRYPNDHRLLGELYSHKSEIYDFDVSAWDEFLVTASKDKSVGIKCLGSPNHDTTSISELT